MKVTLITAIASAGLLATGFADPAKEDGAKKPTEAEKAKALVEHQDGSEKVSIEQDKQTPRNFSLSKPTKRLSNSSPRLRLSWLRPPIS